MIESKEVSFQFSIIGETNPKSNFEEKKQFLFDIGKSFESFSKKAIINYVENPNPQNSGKFEIKMPREDFVTHMQLLAKSIEQDFKEIINLNSKKNRYNLQFGRKKK